MPDIDVETLAKEFHATFRARAEARRALSHPTWEQLPDVSQEDYRAIARRALDLIARKETADA